MGLFVRRKGFKVYLRVRARFQVGIGIRAGFPTFLVRGRRDDNDFPDYNGVLSGLRNRISNFRGRRWRAVVAVNRKRQ